MSAAARPVVLSALAYIAVTAAMGRRVLDGLGTSIASDPGDPLLNAAILAWNATTRPWTDAWFQFPIFHPTPDALTLSEHLLGASIFASPVYWLTGNPLTAYNVTLLLSYPLCGLATYALVWRLTRSSSAAFLSGLAFAFAPYRASQLPHLQMLLAFWAPLGLLGLHGFSQAVGRGGDGRRWWWLALFAACWLLQGASNGYFLVYFSLVVALWVAWFLATARRWRAVGVVSAATAVAALPLLPILVRYVSAQRELGLERNLGEIAGFGADIAAPFCAAPSLTFWGWLRVACAQEGELFAGAALVALCIAGAWGGRSRERSAGADAPAERRAVRNVRRAAIAIALVYAGIAASVIAGGPWSVEVGPFRASASSADKPMTVALLLGVLAFALSRRFHAMVRRRGAATFYLLTAAICWVLSWGPFPRLLGSEALYQAPFGWLMQLPGVDGLRVPARFWMMSVLCLAVGMGLGVARLLQGRSRRASAALVTLFAGGLLMDGWMTIPTAAVPAVAPEGALLRGRTVLVLPLGEPARDVAAVYRGVTGGWRLVNGFSGYEPVYYEALRTLSAEDAAGVFSGLGGLGELHVIDAATGAISRMPGRPSSSDREQGLGRRLDVVRVEASCSPEGAANAADGDIDTSWVCGTQMVDHQVAADLGAPARVGAIVHALGSAGAFFPRHLTIDTSADGVVWSAAWAGSPAAAVLSAALRAPRSTRAVLPFVPRDARFVRLRQTGRHPVNYWAIAELEVWSR